MNETQATLGSPAIIPAVLEAWSRGLTGEEVVSYVWEVTGCDKIEIVEAIDFLYNDMKD